MVWRNRDMPFRSVAGSAVVARSLLCTKGFVGSGLQTPFEVCPSWVRGEAAGYVRC